MDNVESLRLTSLNLAKELLGPRKAVDEYIVAAKLIETYLSVLQNPEPAKATR